MEATASSWGGSVWFGVNNAHVGEYEDGLGDRTGETESVMTSLRAARARFVRQPGHADLLWPRVDVPYADARHVAMVRRLGFRAAVSTAPGVVNAQADLHQLPRFTPWDRAPLPWLARLMRERLRSGAAATATAAQPA